MTTLQILGGIFFSLLVPWVGVLMRVYARKHWNNAPGVKWRHFAGTSLLIAAAAAYDLVFHPPIYPLAVLTFFAAEVLFVILVLESTNTLQDEPWPGVTKNGGLGYKAMHQIEDLTAIMLRVMDKEGEAALYRREADYRLHEQKRVTREALVRLQSLRHLSELTRPEIDKRVDEMMEREAEIVNLSSEE